jgi:tetratricopeptide (TPR) repeat protein
MVLIGFLQNLARQVRDRFAKVMEMINLHKSDERTQTYLNLIKELLSCQSGKELEILADNQELLDAGFLQMVLAMAQMASEDRQEDTANWLLNLAIQVITSQFYSFIGNGKNAKSLDLKEIDAEGKDDAQKFDLAALLLAWANTQNNLGNAYSDRIKGDKAENLEQAIACYRSALKVYNFDAFPEKWANTQNNLGNAYSHRIKENKVDNLEAAIACYRSALKVYNFDAFPEKWANTQNNLGSNETVQNWTTLAKRATY